MQPTKPVFPAWLSSRLAETVTIRLHNLMPLISDSADYDRWLSSEVPPIDLLRPYPAKKMTAYEIGQQINKRGYDAPDIIAPAPPRDEGSAAPELPP